MATESLHCGLENCELMVFQGVGKYNIPFIKPVKEVDTCPHIRFDYGKSIPEIQRKNYALDFCVEDSVFLNCWRFPERYTSLLKQYRYVIAPDFSIYANTPVMYNMWNHYRKHWLSAYWQYNDVNMIPLIRWSLPETYDYCFDGEPMNSVVCISTIGIDKQADTMKIFLDGFFEMMKRLNPSKILCINNRWQLPEIAEYVTPVFRAKPISASARRYLDGKTGKQQ